MILKIRAVTPAISTRTPVFPALYGEDNIDLYSNTMGKRRYHQSGVYLQDDMAWNKWHATFLAVMTIENQNNQYESIYGVDTDSKRDAQHFSGRASLLYAYDNGISPYVSYSSAITPSALAGEDGTLLKPMTSKQYEAGIKYQPVGTSNMYTAAVYDLTQNNVGNRVVVGSYYVPAGKVRSKGIELEARTKVTDRLNIIAGYTYNHVRSKKPLTEPMAIRLMFHQTRWRSLWAQYNANFGVNFGGGVRYIGKQWADNDNTLRVPATTLLTPRLSESGRV